MANWILELLRVLSIILAFLNKRGKKDWRRTLPCQCILPAAATAVVRLIESGRQEGKEGLNWQIELQALTARANIQIWAPGRIELADRIASPYCARKYSNWALGLIQL